MTTAAPLSTPVPTSARTGASLMDEARSLAATPIVDLLCFDDTVCVVTGGAKGIGYAIALRFAELGAQIVLVDLDPSTPAAAERIAHAHAVSAEGIVGDICDSSLSTHVAAEALAGERSRLVWVNSAGIYPTNRIADMSDADWARVLDLDLTATFYGCRAAALAMRTAGTGGVIVNISSVAGFRVGAPPGIAHYASAKHGVQGLTKALAVELGRDGIRVVCLAPGTILSDGLIEKFGDSTGGEDDPYMRMARTMPIRRPGLPDDVARVAVFVASPLAAMLTGTIVPVDGGHLTL